MADASESLTVTDNRTGQTYELPIEEGAIRASALRLIKLNDEDPGLLSYDPGYIATASCRSAITFIDGERGILRYRGYPIEELAEHSSFLEVAYLLVSGELPNDQELALWVDEIKHHTLVHENIRKFVDGFHHDAHPMGILISTVAALSTFYPDAKDIDDAAKRRLQIVRMTAKSATLAALAFRHAMGFPYVYPDNDLSYTGNFLSMMFKMAELKLKPEPALERALDVLFMLHADLAHGAGRTVLLVVGVQHEQDVEPAFERRLGLELELGHLEHHAEEVPGVRQVVVRVDVGKTHRVPEGEGGQGRALGRHPDDLQPALGRVVDVLGVRVEGRQGGNRADQNPHRVGVVVEAVDELADVLVHERVVLDLVHPQRELLVVRQLTGDQQVGDLEEAAVLGQLLDRVPPVAQDAALAVNKGDRTAAARGRDVAGVVAQQSRVLVIELDQA